MELFFKSSPDFFPNVPVELNACGNAAVPEAVVLSKILRQELNNVKQAIEVQEVAVRCEELPVLQGSVTDFEKLFHGIIRLILQYPFSGNKQLLSIRCKELLDKEAAPQTGEEKTYAIQFHTNIALEPYWQVMYQNQLKECRQIAARYNGQLIVNNLDAGCLYILRLSAKSL